MGLASGLCGSGTHISCNFTCHPIVIVQDHAKKKTKEAIYPITAIKPTCSNTRVVGSISNNSHHDHHHLYCWNQLSSLDIASSTLYCEKQDMLSTDALLHKSMGL